jgi:hypothetical protein
MKILFLSAALLFAAYASISVGMLVLSSTHASAQTRGMGTGAAGCPHGGWYNGGTVFRCKPPKNVASTARQTRR